MKYLKLFTSHSDYNTAKNGLDKPNVSYCVDNVEVHYNPIPSPSDLYLTFDILSDGTITWKKYGSNSVIRTISYSFDNGVNWTSITSSSAGETIPVIAGDKIIFKGQTDRYCDIADYDNYNYFGGTASFNVYGNILSLMYGDNFTQYTYLPDNNDGYGHLAYLFYGSNVVSAKNLVLPSDTTNIDDYSYNWFFGNCTNLVEIPPVFIENQHAVYRNCTSLTSVTIPNGVEVVGNGMFDGCTGLTSVTLPNTLTRIEASAFRGCTNLTNITIPNSITYIGQSSFKDCTSLASITIEATTPPTLGYVALDNNASGRKIYVPANSETAYEAATNWSTYAADIEPIPTT